jgi:hypothetical protein
MRRYEEIGGYKEIRGYEEIGGYEEISVGKNIPSLVQAVGQRITGFKRTNSRNLP